MSKQVEKTVQRLVDRKQLTFDPKSSSARNPYEFDLDKNGFPLFTDKNIRFVKGIIRNDSSYNYATDEAIRDLYAGAAKGEKASLAKAVWFTDKINSTHLSVVFNKKRDKLSSRQIQFIEDIESECCNLIDGLFKKSKDSDSNLIEGLSIDDSDELDLTGGRYLTFRFLWKKFREKSEKDTLESYLLADNDNDQNKNLDTRAKLVSEIARATENEANEELDPEEGVSRVNFSFASKFCHHACIQISDHAKDYFCIYDGVVADILPYYAIAYANYANDEDLCSRLSSWLERASNLTKTNATGTKLARIRRILIKLKNVDGDLGYRLYLEFYLLVRCGVNKWRKDYFADSSPLGFDEIDSLLWYFFKGARRKWALREMGISVE